MVVRFLCGLTGLIFSCAAAASAGVALSGVFGDKAVLTLSDGSVRTLKKNGPAVDGMRLLSTESGRSALVEVNGQQVTLKMGAAPLHFAPAGTSKQSDRLVLRPDSRGHLTVDGAVNQHKMHFLVDTGATYVAISAADARRIGIDYRSKGQRGISQTANGPVATWKVLFDSIRIGDIQLHNVEGVVLESSLTTPLLGMSALKRIEMQPESGYYILRKRY